MGTWKTSSKFPEHKETLYTKLPLTDGTISYNFQLESALLCSVTSMQGFFVGFIIKIQILPLNDIEGMPPLWNMMTKESQLRMKNISSDNWWPGCMKTLHQYRCHSSTNHNQGGGPIPWWLFSSMHTINAWEHQCKTLFFPVEINERNFTFFIGLNELGSNVT